MNHDNSEAADTCENAFREIVDSCVRAIDTALAVFLETDDPAGPHKTRVGLRRLTTALDAFHLILRRRPAAHARLRAKKMFRDLGKVRDSDVHLSEGVSGVDRQKPVERNLRLREKVRNRLRKDRLIGFTQELSQAMAGGGDLFRRSEAALALRSTPVDEFAATVLQKAWSDCLKYGTSVQSIPERDRHEFRKDMKTMRYLAEFFDLHFPGLQQEPFRSDFRDIQDALGKVNDHYVVLRIEGRKPPVKVPSEVKQAIDDAEILWARLSAAKVPWGDQATRRP